MKTEKNAENTADNVACEKLLAIAADCANLQPADVLESIRAPDWDSGGRMYNWRRHVLEQLQAIWGSLATETRLALFVTAKEDASSEDWDSALL